MSHGNTATGADELWTAAPTPSHCRWADAEAALEETLSLCRAVSYPYPEAKTLNVYGLLEIRLGQPAAAHQRLLEALAICARLGERLYAGYTERALQETVAE